MHYENQRENIKHGGAVHGLYHRDTETQRFYYTNVLRHG